MLVALPSFSLGESLLSHYVDRIPALEHRYLLGLFMLNRLEHASMVLVVSEAPAPEVLDYYVSLIPPERQATVARRLHVLEVPDAGARAIAAKLLDRPDLIEGLRDHIGGRTALHRTVERHRRRGRGRAAAAARRSTARRRRCGRLAFKSAGRRLFREAGVPLPVGCEDVRSVDDVLAAIAAVRAERPLVGGVVLKLDDSGAGDGNVVLDLRTPGELRAALDALPDWYLQDLAKGGVVEELITGTRFASPSAQIDVLPDGRVGVLATHEQVLGGAGGQVYMGCRFPADPAYARSSGALRPHGRRAPRRSGRRRAGQRRLRRRPRRRRGVEPPRPRGEPPQGRHDPPVLGAAEPGARPLRRGRRLAGSPPTAASGRTGRPTTCWTRPGRACVPRS